MNETVKRFARVEESAENATAIVDVVIDGGF